MERTRYSCQILMKLEFSGQIFEDARIRNFMKILAMRAELFRADGEAERRDEADCRFSQLRERV
jgi:hypothetical protein